MHCTDAISEAVHDADVDAAVAGDAGLVGCNDLRTCVSAKSPKIVVEMVILITQKALLSPIS